jgi:glucokinase
MNQPVAGIDLGGTKIEAVVFDDDHEVLGRARHPTPASGGPKDVAAAILAAVTEACEAAKLTPKDLAGVGVGSPGVVDPATGTVSGAGNLPDWEGSFALGPALSDKLGATVTVGNDVAVATDAEFELGAGRPYHSLLGVFWGTGVGGGVVLDDQPWHGRGAAGEIGHMVVKIGGRQCPCGRKGCMEAYSGRGAMETRARKRHADGEQTDLFKIMEKRGSTRLTSAVWAKALEAEDALATELIDEAVDALAAGIGSAVNLLDVEAVVIGGGLGVRFGEPMTRRIEQAMLPHVFNIEHPPEVHLAALGDLGGALGAWLLARRAIPAAAA